ncbi:hypothetical protein K438DRAFT_1966109 [Mycena galopus ATCC 62051]|nr:hypothetical protein K438DRAFT_1966109 [Mycena galopus ATCC 62051]
MSSSLKRPTSSRPADIIDSSDDEVAPTPVVKSSPRYNFSYPKLSTTTLPAFQDHPFWHSLGNRAGRTLITFALRARTPGHGIKRKALSTAFHDGLPYFRLAVSTLDPSKSIPKDITLCLAGLFALSQTNSDVDDEWTEFIFPDLRDDPPPCHPNNVEPPWASREPSDDELQLAPHLAKMTIAKAEPPQDGPPPSKHSRNSEVTTQPTLAAGTPARKTRSADKPTPAKVVVRKTPVPDAPSKTAAKLLKTLPAIEMRLKEIGDSRHEIATFPADDFIVTISVSRKQGSTIPHPHSHVGVTNIHRKTKTADYTAAPVDPMPLISLEAVRDLEIENAVEPLIGCTPCNLLRVKCQPNSVGVTCQSCSFKKMGAICDHTMDTAHFAALMYNLADKASVLLPTVPISVARLKHVADMVAATRHSFVMSHGEFCLHLHTFRCAIRNQADALGKEGFHILFSDLKKDEDAAAAFNTLIGLYNAKLAQPVKEPNVDNEEDAIGELDLSSPKEVPDGSLVPYDSDDDDEVPQKLAARSPTKSPNPVIHNNDAPATAISVLALTIQYW